MVGNTEKENCEFHLRHIRLYMLVTSTVVWQKMFSVKVGPVKEWVKNKVGRGQQRTLDSLFYEGVTKFSPKTMLTPCKTDTLWSSIDTLLALPPDSRGLEELTQFHIVTDLQQRRKLCLGCMNLKRSQVLLGWAEWCVDSWLIHRWHSCLLGNDITAILCKPQRTEYAVCPLGLSDSPWYVHRGSHAWTHYSLFWAGTFSEVIF